MKLVKFALYILSFKFLKFFNQYPMLPRSVTIYSTYRCNSKCKTCNIWQQDDDKELSLEEWRKVLKSLGRGPVFITITGGECFLRDDLPEIVEFVCKYNQPIFLNLATNGIATSKIVSASTSIAVICKRYGVKLTINFSLDHIGEKYNVIRGVIGGFKRWCETFNRLKNIVGINAGINLTVSKFNVDDFQEIYLYVLKNIKPHSFVLELATLRRSFYLKEDTFSPDREKFLKVLDQFEKLSPHPKGGVSKLIYYLRRKYYQLQKLPASQWTMPCYAGAASIEILPTGEIITCCTSAELITNLSHYDFNFRNAWRSTEAKEYRQKIRKKNCRCSLANPYYTNSIINYSFFFAFHRFRGRGRAKKPL